MTDLGPGIPETLKHYRLVRRVGTGGMGAVFEAIDRRVDSRVAIKVLHPHLATDESFRERFEREAHVAALLRSPYTVHLVDYGYDQGFYFLVMEFVDGKSVARLISEEGRLDPRRAVAIAADAARALEEAQARDVIHRDIKPDNILLSDDGSVKVADFGVARRAGGGGDLASASGFIGTSAYAAPEQATDNVDKRADIYALGATLYCMLTGQPPFSGSAAELLRQHQEAPLPMAPLAGLPDQLVNIIRRCMEKEREDRYPDATALAGALERAARSLSSAGPRTNPGAGTVPAAPVPPVISSGAAAPETVVSSSPNLAAAGVTAVIAPETSVSSMAAIESAGAGAGAPPRTPFAGAPAGSSGASGRPANRNLIIALAAGAAAIVIGGVVAIAALTGGGGDSGDTPAGNDGTPTRSEQTRTARTREARTELTREARTAAAGGELSTRESTAAATNTLPPSPTQPPTELPTSTPLAPTTTAASLGRIVAGEWTYNFVTVSNTCGSGPDIGDEFVNSFTFVDSDGDGYISDGEDVTIVDGQNGNTIGTYLFSYPKFTFEAELEDGDFVVLRNQYSSDSIGSSLREDHYTVSGRPCVIAFED